MTSVKCGEMELGGSVSLCCGARAGGVGDRLLLAVTAMNVFVAVFVSQR